MDRTSLDQPPRRGRGKTPHASERTRGLAGLGWLLLVPRAQINRRIVLGAVIAPVCGIVSALIRSALVEDRFGNADCPYPFMNVQQHGNPIVLGNVALVALLFLAIAFGALALHQRLPSVRPDR